MTLVDTSVWIDHLRSGSNRLQELLLSEDVLTHPFIIGEVACGNLKNRSKILSMLKALPTATIAGDDEVMALIENRQLYGTGVGWIDMNLIASALLTGCSIWTMDKRLSKVFLSAGLVP